MYRTTMALILVLAAAYACGESGEKGEGVKDGEGACVMHQEEPSKAYTCVYVLNKDHCDVEAQNYGVDEDYSHYPGMTCADRGYKYCEFNGCIEGGPDQSCSEGGGTHFYATSICDNDYPPSDGVCVKGGVVGGIWHSINPNETLKAHWDFDQCRVVSWDATGTICGFHVKINKFSFTETGADTGTLVVSYGDYYNWTMCEPDAHWELDPTAPTGEQVPINWSKESNGDFNINGEIIKPGNGGKNPPPWDSKGQPEQGECGTIPAGSCN